MSKISSAYWGTDERQAAKLRAEESWKLGSFDRIDRKSSNRKMHMSRAVNFAKDISPLTPENYEHARDATSGKGKAPITLQKVKEYFGSFEAFVDVAETNNHTVVSIEDAGYEDVYDITVDEFENFATSAGVFVHNSPSAVRNAVMELVQFKSINGMPIPNLRMVWTAINPHDNEGTYDVDRLDPAQLDRFQIQIDVPYKPSVEYFTNKYGQVQAKGAIEWWSNLSEEIKDLCSPRPSRLCD